MTSPADTIGEALLHSNLLQPAELERALIVNDRRADGIGPLLVRTLCRDCREPDAPSPAQLEELQRWAAAEDNSAPGHDLLAVLNNDVSPGQYRRAGELVFYRATGCKSCSYTGYHGRTVISELLVLSESVRRLILSRADAREIQQEAINAGMDSMKIDGLRKALQGVTTIEEVARVTQG